MVAFEYLPQGLCGTNIGVVSSSKGGINGSSARYLWHGMQLPTRRPSIFSKHFIEALGPVWTNKAYVLVKCISLYHTFPITFGCSSTFRGIFKEKTTYCF